MHKISAHVFFLMVNIPGIREMFFTPATIELRTCGLDVHALSL